MASLEPRNNVQLLISSTSPTTSTADPSSSSRSPTLSPGHAAILEMHANSQSNAIIYIGVVLVLYALGMIVVMVKYIRTERYEARLTRLFHDFMRRDRFFRLSRRRSSIPCKDTPAPSTTIVEEDDPRRSPSIQDARQDPVRLELIETNLLESDL